MEQYRGRSSDLSVFNEAKSGPLKGEKEYQSLNLTPFALNNESLRNVADGYSSAICSLQSAESFRSLSLGEHGPLKSVRSLLMFLQ